MVGLGFLISYTVSSVKMTKNDKLHVLCLSARTRDQADKSSPWHHQSHFGQILCYPLTIHLFLSLSVFLSSFCCPNVHTRPVVWVNSNLNNFSIYTIR